MPGQQISGQLQTIIFLEYFVEEMKTILTQIDRADEPLTYSERKK